MKRNLVVLHSMTHVLTVPGVLMVTQQAVRIQKCNIPQPITLWLSRNASATNMNLDITLFYTRMKFNTLQMVNIALKWYPCCVVYKPSDRG